MRQNYFEVTISTKLRLIDSVLGIIFPTYLFSPSILSYENKYSLFYKTRMNRVSDSLQLNEHIFINYNNHINVCMYTNNVHN